MTIRYYMVTKRRQGAPVEVDLISAALLEAESAPIAEGDDTSLGMRARALGPGETLSFQVGDTSYGAMALEDEQAEVPWVIEDQAWERALYELHTASPGIPAVLMMMRKELGLAPLPVFRAGQRVDLDALPTPCEERTAATTESGMDKTSGQPQKACEECDAASGALCESDPRRVVEVACEPAEPDELRSPCEAREAATSEAGIDQQSGEPQTPCAGCGAATGVLCATDPRRRVRYYLAQGTGAAGPVVWLAPAEMLEALALHADPVQVPLAELRALPDLGTLAYELGGTRWRLTALEDRYFTPPWVLLWQAAPDQPERVELEIFAVSAHIVRPCMVARAEAGLPTLVLRRGRTPE